MKYAIFGWIIFVVLWLLFASFQWPNGAIRIYQLMKVEKIDPNKPSLNISKRTFKLYDGYVTETNAQTLTVYKDCFILNKKNWQCFTESKKYKFGMVNGNFYEYSIKDRSINSEMEYVSELRYHLNGCAWDRLSGGFQLIACPLRPFFNHN